MNKRWKEWDIYRSLKKTYGVSCSSPFPCKVVMADFIVVLWLSNE